MNSLSRPTKAAPPDPAFNRPFWEHAQAGRLAVQRLRRVRRPPFRPSSPVCPACLSGGQSWTPGIGRGTLESWIAFHRAYWDGFKEDLPYRVCLVRLAEGPLFVSNLLGDHSQAKIGARLRVTFERATEEISLPSFVLA